MGTGERIRSWSNELKRTQNVLPTITAIRTYSLFENTILAESDKDENDLPVDAGVDFMYYAPASASFLSKTCLNEANGYAPSIFSGSEPSLFTIMKDGVLLNPKEAAK